MIVITAAGTSAAVAAARATVDAMWDTLAPHVHGAYANFLSSATAEDVAAVYPTQTYRRLAAAKRRYDPGNLFSRNHNVRPR
jgi:FAD/FMN-containing dehydrogenase